MGKKKARTWRGETQGVISAVRDEIHDLSSQSLDSGNIGVFLVALVYFFGWKRAYEGATIKSASGGIDISARLLAIHPEFVYPFLFWPMVIDILMAVFIVAFILLVWDFVFLKDISSWIGRFDYPGALATVISQMTNKDVYLVVLYAIGVSWLFSYAYAFALHAKRAHKLKYKDLIERTFQVNITLVMGSLVTYAYISKQ